MKVGVILQHTCGHYAYHVAEQQKTVAEYQKLLGTQDCPECRAKKEKQ